MGIEVPRNIRLGQTAMPKTRVMWAIVCFIIIPVYVAIREDIMPRQSVISTMISGWRMFKDSRAVDDGH